MLKNILFLCFTFCYLSANAQVDSTVLTYEEYIQSVLIFHPIAQQADLKIKSAINNNLAAKGFFDPKFAAYWNEKDFDDKTYFRQFGAKLKVPTRLPIDVVGSYENTDGQFLNPENKTDRYGLWSLGLEANLLQGLLIDERRTVLKQAAVFEQMAQNQKDQILNDLIYQASLAYLYWQQQFYITQIIEENITLAEQYLENTKQSFFGGEKAAIDTLEAFILLRDRNTLLQSYQINLAKAQQHLENFLWNDQIPLELRDETQPEGYEQNLFDGVTVSNVLEVVVENPMIQEKLNKQRILEIEQRLKREKLKPKLKIKYNPLLATENNIAPSLSLSDYKWGFDFAFPLFFREGRAAVRAGEIKLMENELEIRNKQNELKIKLRQALNSKF